MTARQCMFQEMVFRTERTDGLPLDDWGVTEPCGKPASHRLELVIEGLANKRQDFLCCEHRAQTLDEIMSSEFCGVIVTEDQPLAPTVTGRVYWYNGSWVYQVTVVSNGGTTTVMPPVKLAAATLAGAELEAAEKIEALQRLVREDGES
jgi:hypothetical protein